MNTYLFYKKNIIDSQFFYHISQLYLYMITVNILIAACCFVIGYTINSYVLPVSFCAAIMLLVFFYDNKIDIKIVFEIIFAIIIMLVLISISGIFYDTSYDGNAIHKLAVGLLKNHWNPLNPHNMLSAEIPESNLWVNSYCKATWIFGASIYTFTGNIENGKVYTLIGIFCAFFITYYFLKRKEKKTYFCLLFSLSAALNPIAVQQIKTFYVDGFLHIMLYILVFILFIEADGKPKSDTKSLSSLIAASMIICGNIKFTGLLYGGIFCIVYYLWYCSNILKNTPPNPIYQFRLIFKKGLFYAILAIVTIFWAGNSSYLTNFIHHGTFTYPLTGENPIDIMTANSPFHEINRFKNLFLSLFSYMDNFLSASNKNCTLKIPFTINWNQEKQILSKVDIRICGFGLLFSGILVISMIIILFRLIKMKKDKKFYFLLINLITCLGLTFGIKESWWARYSPYIYFIALMALYISLEFISPIKTAAGIIFAALIISNNLLFLYSIPKDLKYSNQIDSNIKALKNHEPLYVYTNFSGIYFNLKDNEIYYKIDKNLINDDFAQNLNYRDVKWKSFKQ